MWAYRGLWVDTLAHVAAVLLGRNHKHVIVGGERCGRLVVGAKRRIAVYRSRLHNPSQTHRDSAREMIS